uniref:Uncharacterized protein n=1 Tax=viral metagenome TaxID=1070528 RepID=A0A6M3JBI7_9ZZZZ
MKNILVGLKENKKIKKDESFFDMAQQLGFSKDLIKQSKAKNGKGIIITEQKIKDFLYKTHFKEHPKYIRRGISKFIPIDYVEYKTRENDIINYVFLITDDKYNKHYISTTWKENLIKEEKELPPRFVLDRIKEAKDIKRFDYLTIARVFSETKKQKAKLPDPFLLGRIKGCSDRFFLAQWDDDIYLDDII